MSLLNPPKEESKSRDREMEQEIERNRRETENEREIETDRTNHCHSIYSSKGNESIIVSDQQFSKRVYQYSSTANYKLAYPNGYK